MPLNLLRGFHLFFDTFVVEDRNHFCKSCMKARFTHFLCYCFVDDKFLHIFENSVLLFLKYFFCIVNTHSISLVLELHDFDCDYGKYGTSAV